MTEKHLNAAYCLVLFTVFLPLLCDIRLNLEALYALDLEVESEGDTLKTLEGLMSLKTHNVGPCRPQFGTS